MEIQIDTAIEPVKQNESKSNGMIALKLAKEEESYKDMMSNFFQLFEQPDKYDEIVSKL